MVSELPHDEIVTRRPSTGVVTRLKRTCQLSYTPDMKRAPLNITLTLASLLIAMNAEAFTLLNAYTNGSGARAGSAEILAYTAHDSHTVLSTVGDNTGGSFGVQILTLGSSGSLTEKGFADFSSSFGAAANWNGASSVSVDPLNRGFGAVALIPSASTTTAGKIGFFDYRAATANGSRNLVTLDVGFHPDSVKFSADGTKLFVVNEGEFSGTSGVNAPGSISIIDLSGISSIADVNGTNLVAGDVTTYDFQSGNLASGVTLAGLRNPSIAAVGTTSTFIAAVPNFNDVAVYGDADFYKGIEPEYLVEDGGKLYVSLQENNAIATFDLGTSKWEKISNLGKLTQTVDGSDQDGLGGTALAQINDTISTLPMPDAIATYSVLGTKYIVSANEGDYRVDDRDRTRFNDVAGSDNLNPILDSNYPTTATGVRANGELGRLQISRIDGDTDADGKIDDITQAGSRSFSIWNADTGALVWDSGSGNGIAADGTLNAATNLESVLLGLDPTFHNTESGVSTNMDARSAQKGPEPEALAVGQIGSEMYAFLGMERQNGLMVYNITNPTSPYFVGYTNSAASGLVSPESMIFISAAESPTGTNVLLTGYELNGGGIGVYGVPEPSRALLSLVGFAFIALRRRRA